MKITKSAGIILFLLIISSAYIFISNLNMADAKEKTWVVGKRGPAGGWIFYDKGEYSDGWRYFEAAPDDHPVKVTWGCSGTSIPAAKGLSAGTGKANTEAIIKKCGEQGIAARAAADYRGGGKNDWFLPSKTELNGMFENLHSRKIGGFANDKYWSSSEDSRSLAWFQSFFYRYQTEDSKDEKKRVRAMRVF